MVKEMKAKLGEVEEPIDEFQVESSDPEDNMGSCILFGIEKCGKTTALSQLKNCLIIDTEKGTNKVKCENRIQVPEDLGPVGKMKWLEKLANKLISEGKKYDYAAIDTFTKVDEWAEWSGTYRYMNSIQGQKFNRVKDEKGNAIKGGEFVDPSSDDYESVHNIGEGYGYRWSREDSLRVFEKLMNIANKCVFFVCHVEDKYIAQKENVEVLAPKQLALTGKLRHILPRKVDGIGYIYNDNGTIKINFTGSEERVGGNRCKHLQGYNNVLDWSKIFI